MSKDTYLAQRSQERALTLRDFLATKEARQRMAECLPREIPAERMTRLALVAASSNPRLAECTQHSILLALMRAGVLGLEPNGRDAHLVPYKRRGQYECQLIPDYKGLIQLAYRSGCVVNVTAEVVYDADTFEFEFGSNERLRHIPASAMDRGDRIYAWAMATMRDGSKKFCVLSRQQVEERRAASQTGDSPDGPWEKHPDAMWRKSAVRELAKWIPQIPATSGFHAAVVDDARAEQGLPPLAIPADSLGSLSPVATPQQEVRILPEAEGGYTEIRAEPLITAYLEAIHAAADGDALTMIGGQADSDARLEPTQKAGICQQISLARTRLHTPPPPIPADQTSAPAEPTPATPPPAEISAAPPPHAGTQEPTEEERQMEQARREFAELIDGANSDWELDELRKKIRAAKLPDLISYPLAGRITERRKSLKAATA